MATVGGGSRPDVGSLMRGLKRRPAMVWDRDRDLDTAREDPELRDLRKLATFNWGNEEEEPSIMFVPGEPSIWNDEWGGGQLVVDTEVMPLLGENLPKFPLEPVFRGVEICSGEPLDPSQFDIITTRKNLRQLFMFCDIERKGYQKQRLFRMEVERMGNTVFLVYNTATEQKKRTSLHSFGLDYERACILPLKDPMIHGHFKEVLSYTLGDLRLLVCSEVDCVIGTKPVDDDFVSEVGYLSVGSLETQPFAPDSPIQYIKRGSVSESYKTVELATGKKGASFRKRIELLTKMYFGGTDFMYFGRHVDGNFDQPKLFSFQQVTEKIGGVPVESLSRLLSLLHNLVSYIRNLDQQQGCALIWFPLDRDTGVHNNKRLNLFWKESPGLQGTQEEPIVHSLPDSLWEKLSSFNHQAVGPSKERKKLVLLPRTKPLGNKEVGAERRSALVFGDARPVDTTRKDRQVEQKLHKQKQDSAKKWSTELDWRRMAVETGNDSSTSGYGAVESPLGERNGAGSQW